MVLVTILYGALVYNRFAAEAVWFPVVVPLFIQVPLKSHLREFLDKKEFVL